jgi:hypothetical protein
MNSISHGKHETTPETPKGNKGITELVLLFHTSELHPFETEILLLSNFYRIFLKNLIHWLIFSQSPPVCWRGFLQSPYPQRSVLCPAGPYFNVIPGYLPSRIFKVSSKKAPLE